MKILRRLRVFVSDDPQRRCYNGAFGAHHYEWGPWEVLESAAPPETVEHKLKFWRDLNQIAVDGRGEEARAEYRAIEEGAEE